MSDIIYEGDGPLILPPHLEPQPTKSPYRAAVGTTQTGEPLFCTYDGRVTTNPFRVNESMMCGSGTYGFTFSAEYK